MTVTPNIWRQGNQGQYVQMRVGETTTFVIDLRNELGSDSLASVSMTIDSGLELVSSVLRTDTTIRSTAHQILIMVRAPETTAVGVYHVKCVTPTANGLTIVKHFDVLIEE